MRPARRSRSANETAFTAEDLSVVLLHYLEAQVARAAGGAEAARRRLLSAGGRDDARRTLAAWLDTHDPRILEQLRRIPLAGSGDVPAVLGRSDYRARVLDVALERLQITAETPTLRIAPDARRDAPKGIRFALVFGAEATLFQDTVLAFQADGEASRGARGRAVSVLGVHHTWLDDRMRAQRALVVDRPGSVCEAGFADPQPLHVVEILHLPRDSEIDLHRRISAACDDARIGLINPYSVAAGRADDKMQAFESWRAARVETPMARRVPRGSGRRGVFAAVLALLGERPAMEVVVQPDHGTEGRQVEAACLRADDPEVLRGTHPLVVHAVDAILPRDDLLVREARGSVRFGAGRERRRIAFRFNVAWNGERLVAESGYAQVAEDDVTFAASRGRGGDIVGLGEALSGLWCGGEAGWQRFVPGPRDVERMCGSAVAAAAALNRGLSEEAFLKHTGIDMVLEVDGSRVIPVVIEANARPAGLASSHEITTAPGGSPKSKVTLELFRFIRRWGSERSTNKCPR